jgi:hypothetical protein
MIVPDGKVSCNFASRYAERLIASVKVIENMRPIGRIPKNDCPVRSLARLALPVNRANANRLIDLANVIDIVSPIGDINLVTEAQVRPLVRLAPILQGEMDYQEDVCL